MRFHRVRRWGEGLWGKSVLKGAKRQQQGIFVELLIFTCLILLLASFALWYIPYLGLSNIHPKFPLLLAIMLGVALLLIFGGAGSLIITIYRGRDFFLSRKLRGIVIEVLFPLMVFWGRIMGISRERIQRSFIEINNQLVLSNAHETKPQRLLLLLPQCIQNFDCDIKITGDIQNCKRCGKCEIKDLIELSEKNKVKIAVATGGTLARRIIVKIRPQAIVAVACELDLTSGIQDAYPIPVIGILNQRPSGPCYNTRVDIAEVREALLSFMER
ncbi:MAG: DUF116 domain-containing protein [Syntrophobacterales bacterium]|nr:MAG: DUF116 domain-containing protein [Syntrophobacterales bacterium]